jgi:trigger factor
MKYAKKILDDKRVEVTFNVTKKEWDDALGEAYDKTKSKYTVQGFRAGHAPRHIIEKSYGDTVFYDEAINNCFYKYYFEFLTKEKDVDPVAMPDITVNKIDDNGLEFVVTITSKPEVTLGAYKGLKVSPEEVVVSEDDVKHELEHLRDSRVKYAEVDRALKSGDVATIDFAGMIDGVKFEGGTANDYDLEIGSHSFIDNFEDQLVGLKKGDKKDVKVSFPEDYHEEKFKGKKAVFAVNVKSVKEKHLPEIDDKFADDVSEFSTLKELKENTKKKLLDNKMREEKAKCENKLIDMIVDSSKVEIPEVMVQQQVEDYIHDFEQRLSYQGLTIDGYLKYAGTTLADLKSSRHEDAKRTVKTRLVLEKIIDNEKITVTDKDLEEKYNEHNADSKKTAEEIKKIMGEEQFNYFQNSLLLNKLMKFLTSNNTIEEESAPKKTNTQKTSTAVKSESTAKKTTNAKTTSKKTTKKD